MFHGTIKNNLKNKLMKYISKIFIFSVLAGMFFTSCQKEELQIENTEKVITQGENFEPAVINGQELVFNYTKNRDKGVYADHSNSSIGWWYVETRNAYVDNSSKTYVCMKVRRSETDGDYFYIMCENLDITGRDGHYIAYEYNSTYQSKYGLLYDWEEANNLKLKVYMNLPMVYQGVEYPNYTARCNARLPNFEDIKYLLGETSIASLPENGTAPSANPNKKYYDAFVGGLGATNESEYTLVGYANNMDYTPQYFFGMQKRTKLWTSVEEVSNSAYPLSIDREDDSGNIYDYVAYVNVAHAKRYALVVRYVFDPPVYN